MALFRQGNGQLRAFCMMNRRVAVYGKLKPLRGVGVAKASANSATSRMWQTRNHSDLSEARMKRE